MGSLIIHSGTVYDGTLGGVTVDGAIRTDCGQITHLGSGNDWTSWPQADEIIDATGRLICPGYIDIHHHGGLGVAYDEATSDAIHAAVAGHRTHGTTRCVISFVTDNLAIMAQRISAAARIIASDPHILGIHPEGPFLDPAHKGAHPLAELKDPTREHMETILDAGDGRIVQMTIAPEKPGGLEAIDLLIERGVTAAVGHTNADYDIARAAFDRGATVLTHAFNGMNGIHHRKPGPVIAALRTDGVSLEIINDTIHVHPDVVKMLFLEATERTVLVTDAMSATCSPDGDYMLGQLAVRVHNGVARLKDGDSLAGSTLTMDKAVANAITAVGVAPDAAIAAATSHPAAAIGVDNSFGRLAVGYPADVLILDGTSYLPTDIFTDDQRVEPTR